IYNLSSTLADPDGLIWRLMQPGGQHAYWRDAEFDKLCAEANVSFDSNLRLKNYTRVNQIINEQAPWIPVFQPELGWGLEKTMSWSVTPTYWVDFRKDVLSFTG